MRVTKNPIERKKELISIAKTLFLEKGVKNVKVSEIVNEAHVAQGTFYYYFKTKDDIAYAVIEEIIIQMSEYLKLMALNKSMSVKQRFEQIMQTLFKPMNKEDPLFLLIEKLNPNMHMEIDRIRRTNIAPLIAKLIEEGCDNGEFKRYHHIEIMTYLIFDGISSAMHHLSWDELKDNEFIDTFEGIEEVLGSLLNVEFNFIKRGENNVKIIES